MNPELIGMKKDWFSKINNNKYLCNKDILILNLCQNKNILDIGCVGQDLDYKNKDWLHGKIKSVSKKLVGVDINTTGIRHLNSMGYEIYHYDNLNRNLKFDILLMLDVIEHVNDPVDFLNTYKNFLSEDGKIIITTPNSNRLINFINILLKNNYALNYEHTFWLCPKTFLEIVHRTTNLIPADFYWLDEYVKKNNLNWKSKIIKYVDNYLISKRSNFSRSFMFILELRK